MSAFRKIPELDWLKVLAEDLTDAAEAVQDDAEVATAKNLMNLYKYLLWSRRYQLGHPQSPEGKIALGLLTKYHRRIYPVPMNEYEKKLVKDAERDFKKMMKKGKV